MNDPDEARGVDANAALSAETQLRNELLTSGLHDLVPLAELVSVITRKQLAATTAEKQALALSVMRSLVDDGLMEFEGWADVALDEVMAHVHDLFVTHYDDRGAWVFALWLKLTDSGKRVAEALQAKAPD
jgi:hypothetical protein